MFRKIRNFCHSKKKTQRIKMYADDLRCDFVTYPKSVISYICEQHPLSSVQCHLMRTKVFSFSFSLKFNATIKDAWQQIRFYYRFGKLFAVKNGTTRKTNHCAGIYCLKDPSYLPRKCKHEQFSCFMIVCNIFLFGF